MITTRVTNPPTQSMIRITNYGVINDIIMENDSKGKVLGHKKAMWGGSIQSNLLMGNPSPNIARNHYKINPC